LSTEGLSIVPKREAQSELSDSLKEWRDTLRVHPISLTLDAAISELHRLHEAAAQAAEIDNHLDDAINERNELRAENDELKKRMAAMPNDQAHPLGTNNDKRL
jgi:uncharacterized coiled-coil DUF342 family protein